MAESRKYQFIVTANSQYVADQSDPVAWLAAVSPALDWIANDRANRLHGTSTPAGREAARAV